MSTQCPLEKRDCVPCRGDTPPLQGDALRQMEKQLDGGWTVADSGRKLHKSFRFADFAQALDFVNLIGKLAESQGHHPDLGLSWGRVEATLWTHKIGGLSESDFVLAAKINSLPGALQ